MWKKLLTSWAKTSIKNIFLAQDKLLHRNIIYNAPEGWEDVEATKIKLTSPLVGTMSQVSVSRSYLERKNKFWDNCFDVIVISAKSLSLLNRVFHSKPSLGSPVPNHSQRVGVSHGKNVQQRFWLEIKISLFGTSN